MSIVIVGGNERMERRYKQLCESFCCEADIYTRPIGGMKSRLGSPDLLIFFTNTMSHKMLYGTLREIRGHDTKVEYCPSASLSALKGILEKHTASV